MEKPIEVPEHMDRPKRNSRAFIFIVMIILVIIQVWSINKIYHLEEIVATQSAEITVLTSQLNYTTSLAENADRYAHSHY